MRILEPFVVILFSISPFCSAFAEFAFTRGGLTSTIKPTLNRHALIGDSFLYHTPRGGHSTSSLKSTVSSTQEQKQDASTMDSINYSINVSSFVSKENWDRLSSRGKVALANLIESDVDIGAQKHVYGDWPIAGTEDENKIKLTEQLADLDSSYPGGLSNYLRKARILLKESADGTNPFNDFIASVPEGLYLNYLESDSSSTTTSPDGDNKLSFAQAERLGMTVISKLAFVLVAGGLGERLGYSGIKLSLETNLVTNHSYLETYCRYIQALQLLAERRAVEGQEKVTIPLVIMTSGDTDPLTRKLLKDNNNYGLEDGQIQIVCQDKVAALKDSQAGLSLGDTRWVIDTKPHGHGDVHSLLLRHGFVDQWEKQGKSHVIFLQDTNALVTNSILSTIGVSIAKGFHMNTICIPRLAGEAAGAITRLEHKSDPEKSLVINVEYNQLDPLLKTQGDCKGDVSDTNTGYSPYPGNSNILIIEMGAYAKTLRGEDQGVVIEFVNPKYKDSTRTAFKKPTRLECMMQDIPKLFQKEMGQEVNIGFTMFDRWLTFSPAKNSLESGIDAVKSGSSAPGTMSSAESDTYIQNQKKLKFAGMDLRVSEEKDLVKIGGIPVTTGPRVVLSPTFATTQEDITKKIIGGRISQRSTLVLDGPDIVVKNLWLDGALIIKASPGCHVDVDGLTVSNKGYELCEIPEGADVDEAVRIRGYTLSRHEALEIIITDPGQYHIGPDGSIKKIFL